MEELGGHGVTRPGERPDLDPGSPAAEATRIVCRWLLASMLANEAGVRDNADPEFLHDFRVAGRRTRSLLSQLKKALPPGDGERYRSEFSWLGSRSGPTRDLDVFLLKLPSYAEDLPGAERGDVSLLQEMLGRRQSEEHALLVQALDSARYASLIRQWDAFLHRPSRPAVESDVGRKPILDVASRRIRKAHRKVLKQGHSIDGEATPEALHQMRIRCKKLRYLLEFFGSLYATEGIGKLISELKRLQDNLGDFNDYVVQQRLLREVARDAAQDGPESVEMLLTAGRLLDRLAAGQELERVRFGEHFIRFSRPENQRLFERLFRGSAG